MKRHIKGISLIEVVLVVAIITILIVTLTVVVVGPAKQAAVRTDCRLHLKQVALAISVYVGENEGAHPPNLSVIESKIVPRCPYHGFDYIYTTGYALTKDAKPIPRWTGEYDEARDSIIKCPTHNNWRGETTWMTTRVDGKEVRYAVPSLRAGDVLTLLGARMDGSVAYFPAQEAWEKTAVQTEYP